MLRDDAISKVLQEIRALNIYDEKKEAKLRFYFELIFGVGYDTGRMERGNRKKVYKLDETGEVLAEYDSVFIAARMHNCSPHSIYDTIAGRQQSAGGYYWRYDNKKSNKNESRKRRKKKTGRGS